MDERDVPAPTEVHQPEATPEPASLEVAASWLAAARPPAVLALLREPDFAFLSMSAFAGFRVNATGYASPLVRRRLAQEITQNEKFAARVRVLAEQAPPAPNAGGAIEAPAPSVPAPPSSGAWGSHHREEELKAQSDRRRRERDEAREALRRAETEWATAQAERDAVDEARGEQSRIVQQQAQRIARLERQVSRMQAEQGQLLKALRQDKVSAPPRPPIASTSAESGIGGTGDAWRQAVHHLQQKGRHDAALGLALDVLRVAPEDTDALDIAARAYAHKHLPREATEMVRRQLSVRLARAEIGPASDALMRLLLALPDPRDAARDVRQWLPHLRTGDAIAAGRVAAGRLRGQSPAAYAWLEAEVRAAVPALADALMPPPGALGPDDPLPLPLPGAWSARRLVDAVNANAEGPITTARESLARMDAEEAAHVWDALTRAGDADDSVLSPLRRAPRGPAVVDGSNAAWFDQHSYAQPRARLRPILELRRTLRRRGYFPVLLYADAPLPYTVDDPQALRALLDRQEIALVDRGVDADEVLLREAKRYGAPLVTNDYMTDWDPRNEVEKIQFTISLTGEAHLLS